MTMESNDRIMLFKLVTGELIIGSLNNEILDDESDMLFIDNPFAIVVTSKSFFLVRYNQFSKLSGVIIPSRNIVYIDLPDENLVSYYQEILNPRIPQTTTDENGETHSLH